LRKISAGTHRIVYRDYFFRQFALLKSFYERAVAAGEAIILMID
jgi:hypothetical protein